MTGRPAGAPQRCAPQRSSVLRVPVPAPSRKLLHKAGWMLGRAAVNCSWVGKAAGQQRSTVVHCGRGRGRTAGWTAAACNCLMHLLRALLRLASPLSTATSGAGPGAGCPMRTLMGGACLMRALLALVPALSSPASSSLASNSTSAWLAATRTSLCSSRSAWAVRSRSSRPSSLDLSRTLRSGPLAAGRAMPAQEPVRCAQVVEQGRGGCGAKPRSAAAYAASSAAVAALEGPCLSLAG